MESQYPKNKLVPSISNAPIKKTKNKKKIINPNPSGSGENPNQETNHNPNSSISVVAPTPQHVAVAKQDSASATYACKRCDRKFNNMQALRGHQNAHKLERDMAKEARDQAPNLERAMANVRYQVHHHQNNSNPRVAIGSGPSAFSRVITTPRPLAGSVSDLRNNRSPIHMPYPTRHQLDHYIQRPVIPVAAAEHFVHRPIPSVPHQALPPAYYYNLPPLSRYANLMPDRFVPAGSVYFTTHTLAPHHFPVMGNGGGPGVRFVVHEGYPNFAGPRPVVVHMNAGMMNGGRQVNGSGNQQARDSPVDDLTLRL